MKIETNASVLREANERILELESAVIFAMVGLEVLAAPKRRDKEAATTLESVRLAAETMLDVLKEMAPELTKENDNDDSRDI